jgi:hypothetical protein
MADHKPMLQQLDMLRKAMNRGYYILDAFRYQSGKKEEARGHVLSHTFSESNVNALLGL